MSEFEEWLPQIRSNPEEWLAAIIRAGNLELALELIRDHPHLLHRRTSGNATPLLVAAHSWQRGIAGRLLDVGARMDIVAAIALGRIGDVRAMLATNPRLIRKCAPEGGWTTLHIGAAHADAEMLTLLISAGANLNGRDRKGYTPLFFATRQPHNAEVLLTNGADVQARRKHGSTVLHCAAAAGNAEFVVFLIAHGATFPILGHFEDLARRFSLLSAHSANALSLSGYRCRSRGVLSGQDVCLNPVGRASLVTVLWRSDSILAGRRWARKQ